MELKKYLDIENDVYINLVVDSNHYHRFIKPILEQIQKECASGQLSQSNAQPEYLRRIERELINHWNAYLYSAKFIDRSCKPSEVELFKTGGNWAFILFETEADKLEFLLTYG